MAAFHEPQAVLICSSRDTSGTAAAVGAGREGPWQKMGLNEVGASFERAWRARLDFCLNTVRSPYRSGGQVFQPWLVSNRNSLLTWNSF